MNVTWQPSGACLLSFKLSLRWFFCIARLPVPAGEGIINRLQTPVPLSPPERVRKRNDPKTGAMKHLIPFEWKGRFIRSRITDQIDSATAPVPRCDEIHQHSGNLVARPRLAAKTFQRCLRLAEKTISVRVALGRQDFLLRRLDVIQVSAEKRTAGSIEV